MTVISKQLFYEKINKDVGCDLVHYWNKTCVQSIFSPYFLLKIIKGSGTFFLPIYMVRLIMDYRKKKKHLVKRFITNEIMAIIYGLSLAGGLVASICFFRKLLGRIHYYSLIFLPGFISGASVLVLPDEDQILNSIVFFNSFIETLLNKLRLSNIQQLFLFMGLSGILMNLFENRTENIDFPYFWFYTPPLPELNNQNDKNVCQHEETCQSYLYNGTVNYFFVGYIINITRGFLSSFNILSKHPTKIVDILFNKSNADFGLFIGAYVGVYRFVSCYLNKSKKIRKKWHGLVSGVAAGLTYTICPTLQVSVLATTTILQLLYNIISKKLKITNHFYQRLLVFCFCHGYNLHNKFYFPATSSPYYYKMIDSCSNNLTKNVYDTLLAKYILA